MNKQELHRRTKQFHIDVIKLCGNFPKNVAAYEIARQLIRSAGSVGANTRATARAKSTDDFINKIAIVIEEADESLYWLEVVQNAEILQDERVQKLRAEANEITAIFVQISKSSKQNRANHKS